MPFLPLHSWSQVYRRPDLQLNSILDLNHRRIALLEGSIQQSRVGALLDDFGTGYSSLAYLRQFAIDVLKIDKRFVDDLADNRDDREIAGAILVMGHALHLSVIAEGVETEAQLAFLRANGCDSYQG